MPILFTVCLLLCSATADRVSPARASVMSAVLLAAPVNATWAANTAAQWREKGFRGFLFQGLREGLAPPGIPVAEANRLLLEIRAAQARLGEAGLDRNFLRLPLTPDAPYFADGKWARRGIESIREAARFCRESGLRGIVLDTRPDSLMFRYRWDGYRLDETPPKTLREGARRFGRQAVRACLRAYPEGEILLIVDPLPSAAPLWHALFQGMLEGPGAAADVSIQVLVGASAGILDTPGHEVDALNRVTARLTARCTPEQRRVWERQGALCLGLEPIRYRQGLPVPAYAIEYFRARLCMAKAVSGAYAWINAPDGGWWEIMPDEVDAYGRLAQGGAAAVLPTPPLPPRHKDYVVRTPVDDFLRVGPGGLGKRPDGFILRDDYGAALLLPRGVPEGFEMPMHGGTLPVTNLYIGTRHEIEPKEGMAVVPPIKGPLLLERLPIARYALPACPWMNISKALTAGERRGEIEFGVENRTGDTLRGKLEAFGAEGYSVGAAGFPVRLEPDETAVYRRAVQGIFREGDRPVFRLVLRLDGGGSAARDFTMPVRPAEAWMQFLDTSARVAPAALLRRQGTLEGVAAVGGDGGLWLLNARGVVVRTLLDDLVVTHVLAGLNAGGAPRVAAFGTRGNMMVLDAQGEIQWRRDLNHESAPETGLVVKSSPGRADTAVTVFPDGSIEATPLDGGRGWRREMGGTVANPTWLGDALVVSVQGAKGQSLVCLDQGGSLRWERELPSAPSCPPILLNKSPRPVLAVALADGTLSRHDPATGEWLDATGTACARPRALAPLPESDGMLLLLTDDRVMATTPEGTVQWSADAWAPRLTGAFHGEGMVIADGFGALHLARRDGLFPWTNAPPHGRLTCAPVSLPVRRGEAPRFLMTFSDASLRLITPQPFAIPHESHGPFRERSRPGTP